MRGAIGEILEKGDAADTGQGLRQSEELRLPLFEAALTGRPLLDVAAAAKVSVVAVLKAMRGLDRQDPEVRQLVRAHSAIVDLEVEGLKSLAVKRLRGLLDTGGQPITSAECRARELTRRTAVAVLRLTLPERWASVGGGAGGPSSTRDDDARRAAEIFCADAAASSSMSSGDSMSSTRASSTAPNKALQSPAGAGNGRDDSGMGEHEVGGQRTTIARHSSHSINTATQPAAGAENSDDRKEFARSPGANTPAGAVTTDWPQRDVRPATSTGARGAVAGAGQDHIASRKHAAARPREPAMASPPP